MPLKNFELWTFRISNTIFNFCKKWKELFWKPLEIEQFQEILVWLGGKDYLVSEKSWIFQISDAILNFGRKWNALYLENCFRLSDFKEILDHLCSKDLLF